MTISLDSRLDVLKLSEDEKENVQRVYRTIVKLGRASPLQISDDLLATHGTLVGGIQMGHPIILENSLYVLERNAFITREKSGKYLLNE